MLNLCTGGHGKRHRGELRVRCLQRRLFGPANYDAFKTLSSHITPRSHDLLLQFVVPVIPYKANSPPQIAVVLPVVSRRRLFVTRHVSLDSHPNLLLSSLPPQVNVELVFDYHIDSSASPGFSPEIAQAIHKLWKDPIIRLWVTVANFT